MKSKTKESFIKRIGLVYLLVLIGVMGLFAYRNSNAATALAKGEPVYCDPQHFEQFQLPIKGVNISRLKAFQLGSVVIAGMAIGNSDAQKVLQVAQKLRRGDFGSRYCTWYLNKGNNQAEKEFTHRYVPNPSGLDTQEGPEIYMSELGGEFSNSPESFVNCAERAQYIGMGCNGQRHRGPTVFGMVLSYSGCSPENAASIVNGLWGLNGIKPEVRLEIIRAAHRKGNQELENRAKIQQLFLTPVPR